MAKRSKKGGGCTGGMQYEGGSRRRMRGGAYGVGAPITAGALEYNSVNTGGRFEGGPPSAGEPSPSGGGNYAAAGGRRRRGSRGSRRTRRKSVATIKRLLKAKGLKVSGSRRALTARARKARIPMKGGGRDVAGGAFTGGGSAGMPDQTPYTQERPPGVMPLPGVSPTSA